jgi:hypothetical protein
MSVGWVIYYPPGRTKQIPRNFCNSSPTASLVHKLPLVNNEQTVGNELPTLRLQLETQMVGLIGAVGNKVTHPTSVSEGNNFPRLRDHETSLDRNLPYLQVKQTNHPQESAHIMIAWSKHPVGREYRHHF